MQVLVTGASGFIGRDLCTRLLEDGHSVTAVVRTTALPRATRLAAAATPAGGLRVLPIDTLDDRNAWTTALRGIRGVVHLAGRAHQGEASDAATRADFQRINVDFTDLLLDCAGSGGVEHIVFMSSSKVFGESSALRPDGQWQRFDAHAKAQPEGPYGASKHAAECLLQAGCARRSMQLTIFRPPLVYGPGVGGNLRALQRAIQRGLPLPLASINNRRSLVHRSSLNDAIARALQQVQPDRQRIYTLADLETSTPDLIRMMANGLMRPARLLPCPVDLLRLVGRITGRSPAVARLSESFVVDSSALAEDLQWQPRSDHSADWRAIGHAFLRGTD